MPTEKDESKYDHSGHSTDHAEEGDLNSPGQVSEDGTIGPSRTDDKPRVIPRHRG